MSSRKPLDSWLGTIRDLEHHFPSDIFNTFGALWVMCYYASLPKPVADVVIPFLENLLLPEDPTFLREKFTPEVVPLISKV